MIILLILPVLFIGCSRNNIETDSDYKSVSDYFKNEDPNYSKEKNYQKAIKAYEKTLSSKYLEEVADEEHETAVNERYKFAYIDEDDIPEMLVCISDPYHGTGITIFTYYEEKVVNLGCYSSSGTISYSERNNRIRSQYGNNGDFQLFISEIKDGEMIPVACMEELDHVSGEIYYYDNYLDLFPTSVNGSHKDCFFGIICSSDESEEIPQPTDDFLIDQQSFEDNYLSYMGVESSKEISTVSYRDMVTIQKRK